MLRGVRTGPERGKEGRVVLTHVVVVQRLGEVLWGGSVGVEVVAADPVRRSPWRGEVASVSRRRGWSRSGKRGRRNQGGEGEVERGDEGTEGKAALSPPVGVGETVGGNHAPVATAPGEQEGRGDRGGLLGLLGLSSGQGPGELVGLFSFSFTFTLFVVLF